MRILLILFLSSTLSGCVVMTKRDYEWKKRAWKSIGKIECLSDQVKASIKRIEGAEK